MKELSKQLPLPEYEKSGKNEERTVYCDGMENKETVMLKSGNRVGGVSENHKI